jgi:hypothetical protein
MKKQIWLTAGIAGMLLGNPVADAKAEVSVHISAGDRIPAFAIQRRPVFIDLPGRGFSVSVGLPYDIISFGNDYYFNQHGAWYRSSNYRGPWVIVRDHQLPPAIRRHRLDDIRRYRDIETRRHDNRRNDNRGFDRNDRRDDRGFDRNDRNNDNRRDNRNDRNDERDNRNDGNRR